MSNVGLRSSTIIWPKTTFGPPSVGYSRASKPFSTSRRRTNAAVSGWARLWAEIVGNRTYSFRISSSLPASASTRLRTAVRAKLRTAAGMPAGHKNPMRASVLPSNREPIPRKEQDHERAAHPGETMELMKGVHVIETYATTTLLVNDRLVLIDTSVDADGGNVLDYFANIKVKPNDLSTIFITHPHPHPDVGVEAINHGLPA